MYEPESGAFVNSSQPSSVSDSNQPLPEPHFLDAETIQQARPAVPLSEVRRRRMWPVALILITVVAGLAGGILASIILNAYRKPAGLRQANITTNPSVDQPAQAVNAQEAQASPNASSEQAANSTQPGANASGEMPGNEEVNSQENRSDSTSASLNGASPQSDTEALRSALNDWIAATNARDINRQMSFYNQTVNAFYLTRNVSASDVRAERERVISRASSVDIHAGQPVIRINPDRRSATMRFIKRYSIVGNGQTRSGEVLQELRWQRVNGRWKIVSERDLKVLQ